MTHPTMNARPHWKILGLAALLLGAVACAPGASNDQVGASDNVTTTPPSINPVGRDVGSFCNTTDQCLAGLNCLTDLPIEQTCGCPFLGPRIGTTCSPAVVRGVVTAAVSFRYADVALLMLDPVPAATADGVPVESYSQIDDNVSNSSGEFAFFHNGNSLDDGTYMVSASLRTGERAQTEPLTLGELTAGKISLFVK